jgi:hypothetical protein
MVATVVSSDNEDHDKTDSIGDDYDYYEERHRRICENCHYIGLIGTECNNCDQPKWAQIQNRVNRQGMADLFGPSKSRSKLIK